ncbi:peptidylprolyl isomerase [Pelagibacterium lentulum]|uniref:Parvulin-like PPIase n=1 Tax=Pelagibacterium lentulum TaxID=2029865 RepID=A0A916VTY9_9HYPH|nr:peptidylprolyl isomerase [Pelagibacterium lentulum]GGA34900.1 peptidylprolyl isomerase [Pelagibacterium lentulum]
MTTTFATLAALLRRMALPCALVLGLAAAPAFAQTQGTQPDDVVARVGDEVITEADLLFAAEDLVQDLQQIPPAERRAFLLTVMIDMKIMANAARDAGLDQTDIFAQRLAYLEDRALRRAFFSDAIEAQITDERIAAAYEALSSEFEGETEYRARHILVPTLEEAQSIREEIEGGRTFADAAGEYGTDGTRQTGGDLGYFVAGQMVGPFEQAVFAMEVGELSEPVETQFGWHLILLEDQREASPPPLDQARGQIAQQLLYETFNEIVGALKEQAEIDIPDPELAAAVREQDGI